MIFLGNRWISLQKNKNKPGYISTCCKLSEGLRPLHRQLACHPKNISSILIQKHINPKSSKLIFLAIFPTKKSSTNSPKTHSE